MKLARRIGVGGAQKISRDLVISGVKMVSNLLGPEVKLRGVAHDAIVGDLEPPVQVIKQVE